MKQLTVTLSDEIYDEFIAMCKQLPNVSISNQPSHEVPIWQQEIVINRMKNAKQNEFFEANEALENLKIKHGI